MRIHKKEINGIKYQAYNDSGHEWIVYPVDGSFTQQAFLQYSWLLRDAFQFFAECHKTHVDRVSREGE